MERMDMSVKCRDCERGLRHPVGNCVLCGRGPAPGAMEYLPKTEVGIELAITIMSIDPNAVPSWRTDWDACAKNGSLNHLLSGLTKH